MDYRMEHDTMGEIAVPADCHWGAQTQRSLQNFRIGGQRQPEEIIQALPSLKMPAPRPTLPLASWTRAGQTRSPLFAGRFGRGSGPASFPWWFGRPSAAPKPI